MPIPALKVKSPQSWKKRYKYPSDKMIKKRRAAFNNKGNTKLSNRKEKIKLSKKSSYYGQRNFSDFRKKIIKKAIKIGAIILVGLFILAVGVFAYYSNQVPTREEFLANTGGSSTKIYDRSGEHLLYNVSGEQKKTWIPLDQIPEHTKWALIATEDEDFYAHRGLDFPALVKVALHELFGIGPQRGGSTITQQLIKNVLLTPERSYRRKFKEMVIAYHMEKKFSKDEILELYLNVIPYGSTAYGVEAAAESYFGKKATELNVAESALLAAMLKATTYYSPYGSHVDELLTRKDFVISRMENAGYISEVQAESAKQEELEFKKLSQNIEAPHFVLYIKELLAEKFGEEVVEKGGLKVITTLDYEKQKIAEEAIVAGVEKNEKNYGAHNAALVSVNAKTGEVLAMVGSRDYFNEEYDGAVNVAMRPRQPGSSFKPIVYAASFEQGLSPETILFDTLTTFKTEIGQDYEPHNYNDKEYGPVSIKKALAGSLNIPAVKTIYLTGVENVLTLAEKLGYSTFGDRSRFGLSLVLGGGEVKLIEHVRAFSVLSQNGQRHNLKYLLRVENNNGEMLEQFRPEDERGEQVMKPEIAKQISSILSDNNERSYVFGESNYLTLGSRPVAAKTGTTNDYRDGWTVGYTPSIVTGVWVGNNDNTQMKGSAAGGNVAAPIWNQYMKQALADSPVEYFDQPDSTDLPQKPMLNGQIAAENKIKIDKISGKLATNLTPESAIEEKVFREVHSILHYVNKNNILGPVPEHPEKDSNYESWEQAVLKWAQENDYEISEKMPTEYDDVHTEANKPDLTIISPNPNQHFNNPILNVNIEARAKRFIDRVEYYIDNQLISTKKNSPYHLTNYQLLGFNNGEKNLTVIVYDDVENFRQQSRKIYLELANEYTNPILWLNPKQNNQIFQENFPYNINIKINNHTLYKKADFYIRKNNESSIWIDYRNISSPDIGVLLEEAQPGEYEFYVLLTKNNGDTITSNNIYARVME